MPDLRDRLAAALSPRYLVDRELASGGMGVVFLGRDPTLGREVAIKVLPPERANAVAVERFLRETRLLAQLAHPNIVPIYDAQHAGELLWFVMPRIRGETLAQHIARGPLPVAEVVRIGTDLLRALEHAHAQGVIHRDIKPANVFVEGEQALLADFGIALLDDSHSDTLTGSGQVVGTKRYLSPEQRAGVEATDRSDLFALGVTLYEAATGRRWDHTDSTATATWRTLPRPLRRALQGALQPDPARRWRDAASFRRALTDIGQLTTRRVAILAGIAGVATLAVFSARTAVTSAPTARARAAMVVLPFGRTSESLGRDLARYTSLPIEFALDGILPFASVDQLTLASARRLSDRVVTGELVVRDGVMDALIITVYRADGRPLDDIRVPGDTATAVAWGRAAADSLVSRLFPTRLVEFRDLAGTHPNRAALDAYFEGQRLFQAGSWHDAEERFATAERIDSTLEQATWHKLIARQWQALPFKAELAQLADRIGPDRGVLSGLLAAQLEPDLERRMVRYDSLAKAFPNAPMVRQMQANELFGRGPLIGRPLSEGIEAFRLAGQEIPELDQPNTYTQTVWGAVRIGEERLARQQLALRHAPTGDEWGKLLWLAVNGRFRRWLAVPAREFMLRTADSATVATLHRAVRIGLDVDNPLDQRAIATWLENHATSDRERGNAIAAQATAMLLLGQPLRAIQQLDRGSRLVHSDPGFRLQRWEWRVLLPLLPGAPIILPDSSRATGREGLRQIPDTSAYWPRAVWALTVDAMAREDLREQDSLMTLLRTRSAHRWIADMVTFAESFAAGRRGQPDSALQLSQRIRRDLPDSEVGLRGPLVRALVYLNRGAWQVALNRPAAAEREWIWHENNDIPSRPDGEPHQGELDAALSAVARLLRAEGMPRLDRQTEACELLSRVHTLWRDAEPSFTALKARVGDARVACPR